MKKWVTAIIITAAGATTGYWYLSPYLIMLSMRAAIKANDAQAFNARVDYPSVRESLKIQLAALAFEQTDESGRRIRGAEALGRTLGLAMINPMVDALIRPETMMRVMDQGVIDFQKNPGSDTPSNAPASAKPAWKLERAGMDRVLVLQDDKHPSRKRRIAVVFDRRGFADWKLTELRFIDK
ncbi:MAG: DUF2939 domain-containing protein [Burkholderiales bacterium]|nr:DUF2939 domain-containing protein [Burkholderiales bacterium]